MNTENKMKVKDIVKINDTIVGIASTGYAGKMNLKNISKDDFQHSFIESSSYLGSRNTTKFLYFPIEHKF